MEKPYQDIIRSNWQKFCDSMNPTPVTDALYSEGFLSHNEYEIINAEKTRMDKVKKLLEMLRLKDVEAFQALMRALRRSQEHLFKRMVQQLKDKGLPADYPEGKHQL